MIRGANARQAYFREIDVDGGVPIPLENASECGSTIVWRREQREIGKTDPRQPTLVRAYDREGKLMGEQQQRADETGLAPR